MPWTTTDWPTCKVTLLRYLIASSAITVKGSDERPTPSAAVAIHEAVMPELSCADTRPRVPYLVLGVATSSGGAIAR
jgi:hypothetical protein